MKISVYIPSYNQKQYLIDAIESVLAQSLKPHQIIIVDDCSSDGSQELIAGYASRYSQLITPIYHRSNQGISRSRNDALQAVNGDYVTYVDGDDRFLPTKLEKEAKLLQENPHVQIAFSNYYYITVDGDRTGIWAEKEIPPQGNIFRQAFAREFPRGNLFRSELVAYSCLKEIGFYDDRLPIYEDWDLKIRLTKNYQALYCSEPLSEYRRHQYGLSQSSKSLHFKSIERIDRKNRILLNDLPSFGRVSVQQKLATKLSWLAQQAAREELEKRHKMLAFGYWLKSWQYNSREPNLNLATQILLPRWLYLQMRSANRSFQARQSR